MQLIRTFIAADIPLPIQQTMQCHVDSLRHALGDLVRWAPVQNIHLTLKFLGEVSPASVEILTQMLRAEADSYSSFDITIGGLGSFPSSKQARVLWVGIQAPAELKALQHSIEAACARLGYASDPRPFSPHLTIGRVRDHISPADQQKIRKALEETTIDSLGTTRIDSIHLYKSELRPGGSVYTKLFSVPLKNAATT
ncbi:MAG: RNA 2',3'-cyclic phosphodiesterase [Chloroflexota bacterium]|nr:RNA 2',3'-cyclic phosphodiesterase [Chloroflexota bacterium]MBI5701929.1 RNA 2',3'-cyclic phosphodiesterase [Chloroflexota bacterium]